VACIQRALRSKVFKYEMFASWAVAKLVRHQALDLAFEGSNPSRPATDHDSEGSCAMVAAGQMNKRSG
jgi:hypothetical protein